jgi:hypothetical protein
VVTVIGAFADYVMSPLGSRPNGAGPPPELMAQVETAMQHIVQGVTAQGR